MNFTKIMLGLVFTICFFIFLMVSFFILKTLWILYGAWSIAAVIFFIGIWISITLIID